MAERKTMRKWFWVWDFEKEEEWLNDMAMNGWALASVGLCTYTFEKCEPGEYAVRLEMHEMDESYISFMRETGAEYVGRMVAWIYFRKKTEDVCGLNLLIGMSNNLNGFRFSWINLVCAALLTYSLGRIHGKKEALERERRLHE